MTDNNFSRNGGHRICSIPGSIRWWREYRGEQRVLPDMTFSGYEERKGTKRRDGENLVECDLRTTELEQQTCA